MRFTITDFPMPPSANQLRSSFYNLKLKRMQHYDASVYKSYKAVCAAWAVKEAKALASISERLKIEISEPGTILILRCGFALRQKRIWTKDGRVKRLDVSNLLKALHDELSKCLGVDDRYFELGAAWKVCIADDAHEYVLVDIQTSKLHRLEVGVGPIDHNHSS
jgi:Holliday junction resolvase RusA-like endonuclease